MRLSLLPLCALLSACIEQPMGYGMHGGGGMSNRLIESYMGASFDSQIAPTLRGTCTDREIATLRQTQMEVTHATNQFDIGGVIAASERLYGVSPGCRAAYQQIAAQICRQSAMDSWQPGSEPYESALARARNCS